MVTEFDRLLNAAQAPGIEAQEIIDLCRTAAGLQPNSVRPFHIALQGMSNHRLLRHSRELVHQAIAYFPGDQTILEAFATWHEYQGDFDVAVAYWKRISRMRPHDMLVRTKLGRALMFATELEEASRLMLELLSNPDNASDLTISTAHVILGEAMLKAGNPNGFAHYIYRIWANAGFYEVPGIAWWNGQALAGKRLLVTHHLGYGDQMLMCAAIPLLERCGVTVGVVLDEAIAGLVAHSLPQTNVFIGGRACSPHQPPGSDILAAVSAFRPDFQTPILNLPQAALALLGASCHLFQPYITAPAFAQAQVAPVMQQISQVAAGRRIVGVAWDCIQRHFGFEHGEYVASFSTRRSIPTPEIATLIDDPAISQKYHFVALHPDTHFERMEHQLPKNLSIIGSTLRYYTDTAAVIAACDSVLSIDMSMANLASLMNVPTTLLLQYEGEWRFGIQGERSPWLTAPRCIRQTIPGAWGPVLAAAREHLLEQVIPHARVLQYT